MTDSEATAVPPGVDVADTPEINDLLSRLATARSLPEITRAATRAARRKLGADGITLVLREGDHCRYADEDAIAPLWKGNRFPLSACISGWCMAHRRTAFIPDIYADPRIPHDAYRPTFVRSLAMVPLPLDEPIAAMGAYWSRIREVSWAELGLLFAFANAAAPALARRRA